MSRINTNVSSLIAQTRLTRSNTQLQTSLTRLSTGLRINSGKDDPAGLIASEALRADITSVSKAITNSERANQLIATADSALGQISGLLNDIRGLVTESANSGTLSQEQIDANQLQIDSSLEAIDRIAKVTTFQGRKLLDGSLDFVTNITSGSSSIASLDVQQATLGSNGSLAVQVDINTSATQALITNDSIDYTAGAPSAGTLTLKEVTTPSVQAQGSVTLTNAGGGTGGAIQFTAVSRGVADGTVGNATDVVFQGASGIAQSTGAITLTNSGGETLTFTAAAGSLADGTAGDNLTVTVAAGGSTAATYTAGTNTLAITVAAGDDLSDIVAAVATDGNFTAVASNGTQVYSSSDDGTFNSVTTGGADGTADVTYNSTTNVITVTAAANSTLNSLATLANTRLAGNFTASATSGGTLRYSTTDDATSANALSGGADAIGNDNVLTVTSGNNGDAYDGTLTINTSSSVTAGTVDVQLNGANITVTLNNNDSSLTVDDIVQGIQDGLDAQNANYSIALTSGTGTTAIDTSSDLFTSTALTGGIDDSGTGLGADLAIKIAGSLGAEVFNFSEGSSLAQVVSAINLVQDSTGVTAAINSGTLELKSTSYGSAATVSIDVISEGTGGTFKSTLSSTRSAGSDVVATVNGVQALGNGNTLSVNTSSLDLSVTVADGSSTDITFNITGGGALFQLGPDVVTNQQARIGIDSVNTGELGGTSGLLYELRSGNAKSLTNDPNGAAAVVDEVITKVNSLRGRLGAFQRTTLETNIANLTDTLANLTEAQSAIRDSDFAVESANLTRAQILVQSGTAVLQIANQNPQNVLSLLRG